MPVVRSASCRYANCCSTRTWWCAWKAWMARWRPHSSPSRCFPLWNAATPSEATHKLQLMEVDLSGMQYESITTAIQTPTYTLVLPPSCWHCRALWWHCCSNQPTVHECHGVTAGGFPCHLCLCLPAQHTKEAATICSSGGSVGSQRIGRSPQARGDRLNHPCPNGNPHADVSAGCHSSWHPQLCPCHSSTVPADPAKDTAGGEHSLCHTASGSLQGWTNWFLRWDTAPAGENECGPRVITQNRATMDLCHRQLELNMELSLCLNYMQAAGAIK